MSNHSRASLVKAIDDICGSVVSSQFFDPDGWDEDHISLNLLAKLTKLNGDSLSLGTGNVVPIAFDAFKQKGNAEKQRGDIALIIVRNDGDYGFAGTAFIEMKKRYLDSGKFDAMSQSQLDRILTHEQNAMVGFYDYVSKPYALSPFYKFAEYGVAILPAKQALLNQAKIDKVLRHAVSFGHQFVYRYLEGADIAISADRAFATVADRRTKYVARIYAGNDLELQREQAREVMERYDNVLELISNIRDLGQSRDGIDLGR